jgi:hypothetical protein
MVGRFNHVVSRRFAMQVFSTKQSRAGAIVLVLTANILSACSEQSETTPIMPSAEPRLNTETQVDGCGSTTSPCKVDGITVKVTRTTPAPEEPPPPPPEGGPDPYTPPDGGFGKPTKGGDSEIVPPVIGPPFSDGPVPYLTCILTIVGIQYISHTPELLKATDDLRYAIEQMNMAETQFQMIKENQQEVGETTYLHYQDARNGSADAYYQAKRALKWEMDKQAASTWTALSLALIGCTPALWIGIF